MLHFFVLQSSAAKCYPTQKRNWDPSNLVLFCTLRMLHLEGIMFSSPWANREVPSRWRTRPGHREPVLRPREMQTHNYYLPKVRTSYQPAMVPGTSCRLMQTPHATDCSIGCSVVTGTDILLESLRRALPQSHHQGTKASQSLRRIKYLLCRNTRKVFHINK